MKERLCNAIAEINMETCDDGVKIYEWDGSGDSAGIFIPKELIGKLNVFLLKAQRELKA